MTVEVEHRADQDRDVGDVSGAVVTALLELIRSRKGDAGLAQALALAGENRPFATLGDLNARSSLDATVALLNAAALVTGDGAVAMHVGEELLFAPDPTGFVARLRALGSPYVALKHVAPVLEHFETVSVASALEIADDHALIRVASRTAAGRHAHLCEMTRGLLTTLPRLYDLGPAMITEIECSARGGRACLYALSWPGPERDSGDELGGDERDSGDELGERSEAELDGDERDSGDELDERVRPNSMGTSAILETSSTSVLRPNSMGTSATLETSSTSVLRMGTAPPERHSPAPTPTSKAAARRPRVSGTTGPPAFSRNRPPPRGPRPAGSPPTARWPSFGPNSTGWASSSKARSPPLSSSSATTSTPSCPRSPPGRTPS